MDKLHIQGGTPLEGEVTAQGSTDSALAVLRACLLIPRPVELNNCPLVTEVSSAAEHLRRFGCKVSRRGHTLLVDPVGGEVQSEYPEGGEIRLPFPDVEATELALLRAVGARTDSVISGASRSPEIVELQAFLNAMGGRVSGAGGSALAVKGGCVLHGGSFVLMGDPIAAATLLCAGAAAGGNLCLRGVCWRHLAPVLAVLHEAGCHVESTGRNIRLSRDPGIPLQAVPGVRAAPFPGLPAGCLPPVMAALCTAKGKSTFAGSRFDDVSQLRRLGADIAVEGQNMSVTGVERLQGAAVTASGAQGGAALAVAALGAHGESVIDGLSQIDRRYESMEETLRQLGAAAFRR